MKKKKKSPAANRMKGLYIEARREGGRKKSKVAQAPSEAGGESFPDLERQDDLL